MDDEPAHVIRRLVHDIANDLAMPRVVLESLRDHPGLDEAERDQIDQALARLDAMVVSVRTLQALILRH